MDRRHAIRRCMHSGVAWLQAHDLRETNVDLLRKPVQTLQDSKKGIRTCAAGSAGSCIVDCSFAACHDKPKSCFAFTHCRSMLTRCHGLLETTLANLSACQMPLSPSQASCLGSETPDLAAWRHRNYGFAIQGSQTNESTCCFQRCEC